MMHHPNIHHQPMSGHPQHMPGHQPMPGHHQLPHQMHRENRHVTMTRVPLGPSQAGAMGHGQLGGMGVHHGHHGRPHTIRPVHHPPTPHHNVPPPTRLRRPYGGGYTPGVVPFTQPPPMPPPAAQHNHIVSSGVSTKTSTPSCEAKESLASPTGTDVSGVGLSNSTGISSCSGISTGAGSVAGSTTGADGDDKEKASGDGADCEARSSSSANSKEKTPMCLVNELARYNKIKHQYRLTSETGPAHKKVFTVTLRLGDTEEYTAEGSSIKRAQHAAAGSALSGTRYPPPPPRAPPPHAHHAHHHRHAGTVMPTVELNALAMKLCQPAVYTSVPAVPRPRRLPYRMPTFVPPYPHPGHPAPLAPRLLEPNSLLYRVRVSVGGRSWVGEGATPQGARHDAAARALHDLRPAAEHPDNDSGDAGSDNVLNSDVKSPVSLVHELALKRDLSVQFTVKSERGPPHMRVFVTLCTVGEMETEGEGNGKKISKRRAAERMLEEMKRRWPPALLRARPPADRRRHAPTKKKPRNLIKEGGGEAGGGSPEAGAVAPSGGADNPISRLAVARHAARARSPQYKLLEERGAARRREFLVQCDAPPHSATGLGPNKKTAKRRAAHNVLLAMEMSAPGEALNTSLQSNGAGDGAKITDGKRKEDMNGGANSDVRQPVPGVILMDYHTRSGHPPQPNGISESSATGSGIPAEAVPTSLSVSAVQNTPGAKDQLMYLAELLGFTVQFSDFPKRNHGEYLSLVSLSTEPPLMCHGGGASTANSHEQCARAALRALALMGLDAATTGLQSMSAAKPGPGPMSNGIKE